jgi:outer membrane protein assembly factor BamD (BamD/ComL family)
VSHLHSKSLQNCLLFALGLLLSIGCSKKEEFSDHASDESAISTGLAALRAFDLIHSYETFEQLHGSLAVTDENWALVTYSYAISAWLKTPTTASNVALSVSLLESLTEQYPHSIYTASALIDLGRIAEIADFRGDPTDVHTARRYYQRVIEEFPNSDMSIRATLFLAQTYAQTFKIEDINKAIELLENCMAEQTDDRWMGILGQYIGELYENYLHQPNNAIDPLLIATEAGLPRKADMDSVLWRTGVLAQNAGRDLLAARIFNQIIQDYPRTVFKGVSQRRLEQLQIQYPEESVVQPTIAE